MFQIDIFCPADDCRQQVPTFSMTKTKVNSFIEPVEGSSQLFTFKPTNPQQTLFKATALTVLSSGIGNTQVSNVPDLSFFIINTQMDRLIQNADIIK